MIKLADRLSLVNEYYFSQKLREIEQLNKAGKAIINLGIGSPDLPPHSTVIDALAENATRADTHSYQSYKGSHLLRQAIADWYANWYEVTVDPETQVLPLIGSKEGLMHICMTYLQAGDKVLIPNPGYPTYRSAATIAGASILSYHLNAKNNWYPDEKELEKLAESEPKIMFVNYPNMPTGQRASTEVFKRLVAYARRYNILIIHDNPYSFILNDKPLSMLAQDPSMGHVIELNSLSKSHQMAGWRIGMMIGAKERLEEVIKFKSNMDSGMFLPLQLAAIKALALDASYHQSINKIYAERKLIAYQILDELKTEYTRDQEGLFVWAKIPNNALDAYSFSDKILYDKSVFITPGSIFGTEGDRYIRISLCVPVPKFIQALESIKR